MDKPKPTTAILETITISRLEYNQARDAIAWQQKAREIYPNIAAYIDERMAPPQPTGE